MKKKAMQYLGILLFALIAAIVWKPQQAQAASAKVLRVGYLGGTKKECTVGKAVFSLSSDSKRLLVTKNGKTTKIASTSKTIAGVAVSGTTVYYGVVDWSAEEDSEKGAIYQCSMTGKNRKKVMNTGTYIQTFTAIYQSKIYYIDDCFGELCIADVSTGKVTKTGYSGYDHFGDTIGLQRGKYFYLYDENAGVYVFNAETGKMKKAIGSYFVDIAFSGNYVYFLTAGTELGASVVKCTLYRCRADGSGKKTLVKNIRVNTKKVNWTLTGKKLTYTGTDGKRHTYKF